MNKLIQISGMALWVVIGVFVSVEDVKACFCAPTTIEQRFEYSDYVFTAIIIDANLDGLSKTEIREKTVNDLGGFGIHVEIKFDTLIDYKGSSSELEYLYTAKNSGMCGLSLEIGSTQTFFVGRGKIVGSCGGVLRSNDVSEFDEYVEEHGLE